MKQETFTKIRDTDFQIPADWKQGIPPEQNPYPSVLVDITARCNLRCNFCYYPDHDQEDMTLAQFEHFCKTVPFPITIKLAGGEPTLHPQLPEFIRTGIEYGHRIYVCSNGMRYKDPAFLKSLEPLKKLSSGFCMGLSMDGGTEHSEAYQLITGRDCLKDKLDGFHSLMQHGHFRVCLSAIIVRDFNEGVIQQLIDLAQANSRLVRYIHLRNAGRVGAFVETDPYTIEELKALTAGYFTEEEFAPACLGEIHCPPDIHRTCCYRFRPNRRLQISLIEFVSDQAAQCPKRGRVLLGSDRIVPLFLSIRDEM